jgi:hypothetical protein
MDNHRRVIPNNAAGRYWRLEKESAMASQSSFLTTRFSGYFHREVPQEDAELTHIGPGTPCGEYL